VSAADREAARRSLARFHAPTQILTRTQGNELELVAVSYAVELLIEIAQPLPGPLKERLAPWFAQLRQQQERILADNRRADRAASAA
jgi:hypothetical protein